MSRRLFGHTLAQDRLRHAYGAASGRHGGKSPMQEAKIITRFLGRFLYRVPSGTRQASFGEEIGEAGEGVTGDICSGGISSLSMTSFVRMRQIMLAGLGLDGG